ncbi:MAG: hypothetical protein ACJZ12_03195 [Candidatus Neomarinimicrobiota bacterium]
MKIKLFFLMFPFFIYARSISVTSKLDTNIGYIGDVFKWSIKVEGGDNRVFIFPKLNYKDKDITIRSSRLLHEDIREKANGIEFELMLWDTGNYKTPEYSINILNDSGNFDYSISVNSIDFMVSSILSADSKVDYKGLKGPVPVRDVFPVKRVLIILALISLLLGIIYMWGRRIKPIYDKIDYSITESPKERAFRRLSVLESSLLTKEYYSELSHIMREYIETKFFIRALEMTTEEIASSSDFININKKYFADIVKFLHKSDTVKYARNIPRMDKKIKDKEFVDNIISKI